MNLFCGKYWIVPDLNRHCCGRPRKVNGRFASITASIGSSLKAGLQGVGVMRALDAGPSWFSLKAVGFVRESRWNSMGIKTASNIWGMLPLVGINPWMTRYIQ